MTKCSLGPASLTHIVGLHNVQTERGVRKPCLEQFLKGTREFLFLSLANINELYKMFMFRCKISVCVIRIEQIGFVTKPLIVTQTLTPRKMKFRFSNNIYIVIRTGHSAKTFAVEF